MSNSYFQSPRWKLNQATERHGDAFSEALRSLVKKGKPGKDLETKQPSLAFQQNMDPKQVARLSERTLRLLTPQKLDEHNPSAQYMLTAYGLRDPKAALPRGAQRPADRLSIHRYTLDDTSTPIAVTSVLYRRGEPTHVSPSGLDWRVGNVDPTNPTFTRLLEHPALRDVEPRQIDVRVEAQRQAIAMLPIDGDEELLAHEYLGVTATEAVCLTGLMRYYASFPESTS